MEAGFSTVSAYLSYLFGDDSQGVDAVFDPFPDVDCYLQLARQSQVSITRIFETHTRLLSMDTVKNTVDAAK